MLDRSICTGSGSPQTFNEILNHYAEFIITAVGPSICWVSHTISWIALLYIKGNGVFTLSEHNCISDSWSKGVRQPSESFPL